MNEIHISEESRSILTPGLAHLYRILPMSFDNQEVTFFVDQNLEVIDFQDELELLLGRNVIFSPVPSGLIDRALERYYKRSREVVSQKAFNMGERAFLENLLKEAKQQGSSDIHFEVYENDARIRLRIDGQLVECYKVPLDSYQELVNKIKIRSKLNITEKRLPQDGRIKTDTFDVRVSILPTLFGEKIVMRLLGNDAENIDLDMLGFQNEEQLKYLEGIKKPNGIVLISGPTGSGKTTTLYATLKLLNDSKRNIVTVEDPIEYTLKGINQVQLKEDIGLSFASALKSFLRQDPDIIMLGEIRDSETALMAIRASLTGHLVLSTIHTNSALGTISRLSDMGVPLYLIAETLNLSVAQRLVRKLCVECKKRVLFNPANFPKGFVFPYQGTEIYEAVGCDRCYYTGYKGRRAIYEVIAIDHEIAGKIKSNNQNTIQGIGYKSLSDKAFDILIQGETSLEEIYPILITE